MLAAKLLKHFDGPLAAPTKALVDAMLNAYTQGQEPWASIIHEFLTVAVKNPDALPGLDMTTAFATKLMLKQLLKMGDKKHGGKKLLGH